MHTVVVDQRGWLLRRLLEPESESRPGWSDSPDPADTKLIELLQRRDSLLTTVRLKDGSDHVVKDIAWGYDVGDEYAYITTNASPGGEGLSLDFFYSNEIVCLMDSASGAVIWQ